MQGASLLIFNPFLSKDACTNIYFDILEWLQICVLEDKLKRIQAKFCGDHFQKDNPLLIRELLTTREWNVNHHPEWLVFEVESMIQIRNTQYTVAKSLMDSISVEDGLVPGLIAQLNMGEGKTRVILPMLALYWRKCRGRVVRFNFLPTLIGEAFEYMHQHMCASSLSCKFMVLPFQRDIELTASRIKVIHGCMRHCMREGGIVFVAPEHRQSLMLKWYEFSLQVNADQSLCTALHAVSSMPFIDMLDESDMILRYNSQLIYAHGTHIQLPDGPSRCAMLYALLAALHRNPKVRAILETPDFALLTSPPKDQALAGAFTGIRLLSVSSGKHSDSAKHLLESLAQALVDSPPYELRWLGRKEIDSAIQQEIVKYVTDPLAECLPSATKSQLQDHEASDLLALRGWLAHGVLVHCLERRHSVNYGVKRPGAKRIAVPFRASNTPALRAEFSHADCALAYSALAYYYDGLTSWEVREAFDCLMAKGPSEKSKLYAEWYDLGSCEIAAADQGHLDRIQKIDLSNEVQFGLVCKYFGSNMATINFWLSSCVFPVETMQFPHRLVATGWHLADNPSQAVVGFSGTKDAELLLPLQVKGGRVEEPELQAIDGKVLALLLENSTYEPISNGSWHEYLCWIVSIVANEDNRCTSALIDAGGLMAGTKNHEVAEFLRLHFLREKQDHKFEAIFYFDTPSEMWCVLNMHGQVLPRHRSPARASSSFVYFDQSRCRGADMQLHPDDRGVLTLGPKMRKDDLMQAAMRLRALGRNQKLLLVGTPEVASSICSHATPEAGRDELGDHNPLLDVMSWVISNTVKAVEGGLLEYASQGDHFCSTAGRPDRACLPDVLELQGLYGATKSDEQVHKLWLNTRKPINEIQPQFRKLRAGIDRAMEKLAKDVLGYGSKLEQECERELEKEIELETEVELEVPVLKARPEDDWDYTKALSVSSGDEMVEGGWAGTMSIQDALRKGGGVQKDQYIRDVSWPSGVYMTLNFLETVRCEDKYQGGLNEYLRPVSTLLIFACGDVLLVSEREADSILRCMWKSEGNSGSALLSLCYARQLDGQGIGSDTKLYLGALPTTHAKLARAALAVSAIQLFNGESNFAGDKKDHARSMLSNGAYGVLKPAAMQLLQIRGLEFMYTRSDLDDICEGAPSVPPTAGRLPQ